MKLKFAVCWAIGTFLAILLSTTSVQAQYAWNNGTGGDWMTDSNWTPKGGPPSGLTDTATIDLFSFMTITLPANGEIDSFTFNSPYCNLTSGSLILDSGFNWNAGILLGPARIECDGDSEFTGDSAHVGKTLSGGVFINGGTVNWSSSGDISFNSSGIITNNGIFNCQGTGNMGNSSGANLFVNSSSGTWNVQLSSGSSIFIPAINEGSLQVQDFGTLTFRNTFTSYGTINVSSSGSLVFLTSPLITLNSGSSVTGPGSVSTSLSTVNVAGNFTAGLNLGGGTVSFNGPGLASLARCYITNGTLGGSNQIIVTGPLTWFGGTINSPTNVIANGGLNLAGASLSLSGGTLINNSNTMWADSQQSSTLTFANGASFSNAPGATFTCNLNGTLGYNSSPSSQFINAGSFVMQSGGTAVSSIVFNNSGTIDVEAGVVSLNAGGTNSGIANVNSNATLTINGGTEWFGPSSVIQGPGLVSVASGTLNLAGNLFGTAVNIAGGTLNWLGDNVAVPSALTLSSGTMGGSNFVTVLGPMSWLGGTLNDSGIVSAFGGMTLGSGNNALNLNGSTLIMSSNAIWNGASSGLILFGGNSVLSNAVLFDFASDGSLVNNGGTNLFANGGLIRKTGGTGSTTISVPFYNYGTAIVQTATVALNNNVTNTGLITVLSNATLALSSGLQNFMPGSTLNGGGLVSVLGATFNLAGDLVSNTVSISSGAMNCLGNGLMTPLGVSLSGGTLGGSNSIVVNGAFNFLGGTLANAGGLIAKKTMNLGNGPTTLGLSGTTLVNQSNGTWTGSSSATILFTSSVISNAAGAILHTVGDLNMANFSGANMFANDGLWSKEGGTGYTGINVPFYNRGTTIVQTATLSLNNLVTGVGTMIVSNLATLALPTGTATFLPGSVMTGSGLVSVVGGGVNMAGNLIGNNVSISLGAFNCLGTNIINPVSLLLSGGTLGGTNRMTVSGPVNFFGGGLANSGGLAANGPMTLGNGSTTLDLGGALLINNSNATWTGASGAFIRFTSSVLSNAANATLDCVADLNMSDSTPPNAFANDGLFRKTGGTASTTLGVPFYNRGTTIVQTATLTLNNAVTGVGTMIVSNLATLYLGFGSQSYLPGSLMTGGGRVSIGAASADFSGTFVSNILSLISGGAANFNGTNLAAPMGLNITNGTVGGTNLVTVLGPMNWLAGSIGGSNAIVANGGLTIASGVFGVSLTGRSLVNAAVGKWLGDTITIGAGGVFSNAANGTFDSTFDGTVLNNGGTNLIANAGLFRKTGGTSSTVISVPFNNSGTLEVDTGTINFLGQLYMQTAGTTFLKGGNLANSQPFQLLGGTLRGNGLITGSVTNSGIVDPGATNGQGQLIINGAYTQTTNGAINLEISGPTAGNGFGVLVVSNTATLSGDVNLTLTNGYFPGTNATFTFLTCGARVGFFNNFHYPTNNYLMTLLYTPTNVSVRVISTPAPPSQISFIQYGNPGSGSNTLGFYGISGYPYSAQYATNLNGPWIDFSTNFASTNGTWSVIDSNATDRVRFYRGRSL
jgi:hypothetical protein